MKPTTGAGDLGALASRTRAIRHAPGLVPRFHIGLASDERPIITDREGSSLAWPPDRSEPGGDLGGGVNVIVTGEQNQPAHGSKTSASDTIIRPTFVVGVVMNDLEYGA
jgi:hypothetical protein